MMYRSIKPGSDKPQSKNISSTTRGYRIPRRYADETIAFIEENTEIKEMDINPLFAYKERAVVFDARIILDE